MTWTNRPEPPTREEIEEGMIRLLEAARAAKLNPEPMVFVVHPSRLEEIRTLFGSPGAPASSPSIEGVPIVSAPYADPKKPPIPLPASYLDRPPITLDPDAFLGAERRLLGLLGGDEGMGEDLDKDPERASLLPPSSQEDEEMSDKPSVINVQRKIEIGAPLGLLGVLFVGLKLTGYISWPWIWVTAPFWIPLAVWLLFVGAVLAFLLLTGIVAWWMTTR